MCICFGHAKACPLNSVTKVIMSNFLSLCLTIPSRWCSSSIVLNRSKESPQASPFHLTPSIKTFRVSLCAPFCRGHRWHCTASSHVSLQTEECLIPDTWSFPLFLPPHTHAPRCVLYMSRGWNKKSNSDLTPVSGPSVVMSVTISDVTGVWKVLFFSSSSFPTVSNQDLRKYLNSLEETNHFLLPRCLKATHLVSFNKTKRLCRADVVYGTTE